MELEVLSLVVPSFFFLWLVTISGGWKKSIRKYNFRTAKFKNIKSRRKTPTNSNATTNLMHDMLLIRFNCSNGLTPTSTKFSFWILRFFFVGFAPWKRIKLKSSATWFFNKIHSNKPKRKRQKKKTVLLDDYCPTSCATKIWRSDGRSVDWLLKLIIKQTEVDMNVFFFSICCFCT